MSSIQKQSARKHRHNRIRSTIVGTAVKPRLNVYRSNRAVYAQLIDDVTGTTLGSADSRVESAAPLKTQAESVGQKIAAIAKDKNIEVVVFDRGGFRFHGVVAAIAAGARDGGLKF